MTMTCTSTSGDPDIFCFELKWQIKLNVLWYLKKEIGERERPTLFAKLTAFRMFTFSLTVNCFHFF